MNKINCDTKPENKAIMIHNKYKTLENKAVVIQYSGKS